MRLAFLFLLTTIVFFSCNPDEDKTGNCLTAEINGVEFEAASTTATAVTTTVEWNGEIDQETDLLTIIGTIASLTENNETITLTFACSELTSDLDFVQNGQECGIGMTYQLINPTDPMAAVIVMATDGNISITSMTDNEISGTFSFSGEGNDGNDYTITNGFFDTTVN